MKTSKWLLVWAAVGLGLLPARAQSDAGVGSNPVGATAPAGLSAAAADVLRLEQAGMTEDVVLAQIQTVPTLFGLQADGIVYLKDLGVTPALITAMLNHDATLRGQSPSAAAIAPQPLPVPAPEPAVQPAPAPAPIAQPVYDVAPPPSVTYFYQDLLPYGAWIQLPEAGWCWQPRAVVLDRTWRPYCHGGHWLWTNAGWYWQSDYSWGWAPFHYGRWLLHERCGWLWTPDTVWGPAWVTWRVGEDCCGWAPLPPHAEFDLSSGFRFNGVRVTASFDFGLRPEFFTFIALADFHQHDLSRRRYTPADAERSYRQATIVNNYVVNHAVVNRGVAIDRVTAATHRPVQTVAIRDLPGGAPRPANLRSSDQGAPTVYRPRLEAPARTTPLVAQKVDDRHPVVRHDLAPPTPVITHSTPEPSTAGVGTRRGSGVVGNPSVRPAPVSKPAPALNPLPPGRPTPLGVEVYHRETGPTLGTKDTTRAWETDGSPGATVPTTVPPEPSRAATPTPNSGQGSRLYFPKTTRQESDQRSPRTSPRPGNN